MGSSKAQTMTARDVRGTERSNHLRAVGCFLFAFRVSPKLFRLEWSEVYEADGMPDKFWRDALIQPMCRDFCAGC